MPTGDWSVGEIMYGGNAVPIRDVRIMYGAIPSGRRSAPFGSGAELDRWATLFGLERYTLETAPRGVGVEFGQSTIDGRHVGLETDASFRSRIEAALRGPTAQLRLAEENRLEAFTNPDLGVPWDARPQRYSCLEDLEFLDG